MFRNIPIFRNVFRNAFQLVAMECGMEYSGKFPELECFPFHSGYVKNNTSLPSSASAERLFSYGGIIYSDSLGNNNFEKLTVLLKLILFS